MTRPTGHFEAVRERKRVLDDRRRRERAHEQRREDDQKEKSEDRLENEMVALGVEASIATEQMIEEMTERLEKYSEANMQAMMLNRQQAEIVAARIASMLAEAHTLPDGRRVFRTQDGTGVVDEFGEVVPSDIIMPDEIDPELPTWEDFSAQTENRDELDQEHADLLEFQDQLDAAEVAVDQTGLTEADLNALDADLMTSMPSATRAQADGITGVMPATPLETAFAPASAPQQTSRTSRTHEPSTQTFD